MVKNIIIERVIIGCVFGFIIYCFIIYPLTWLDNWDGKEVNITVRAEDPVVDYRVLENCEYLPNYQNPAASFRKWDDEERNKMAKYMKENNLKIKTGEYSLRQFTPFEEALKIFKFEKIKR